MNSLDNYWGPICSLFDLSLLHCLFSASSSYNHTSSPSDSLRRELQNLADQTRRMAIAKASLACSFICLLSILATCGAQHQCYYPDGNSSSDVPCSSGAGASFCCANNYACTSNKPALISRRIHLHSTIGDPVQIRLGWDPACPQFCKDGT